MPEHLQALGNAHKQLVGDRGLATHSKVCTRKRPSSAARERAKERLVVSAGWPATARGTVAIRRRPGHQACSPTAACELSRPRAPMTVCACSGRHLPLAGRRRVLAASCERTRQLRVERFLSSATTRSRRTSSPTPSNERCCSPESANRLCSYTARRSTSSATTAPRRSRSTPKPSAAIGTSTPRRGRSLTGPATACTSAARCSRVFLALDAARLWAWCPVRAAAEISLETKGRCARPSRPAHARESPKC